jgi:hypothetical protein
MTFRWDRFQRVGYLAQNEHTSRFDKAKNLAARFCDALFDDRFLEVEVFRSWKPWSKWFHGIAWDCTFLIIDKRFGIVTILCETDSGITSAITGRIRRNLSMTRFC